MTSSSEDEAAPVDLNQSLAMTVLARVQGENLTQMPADLYIPPDALEVILEIFEGPLDFLLYLIKKHNLDILNIPVATITHQYMTYIELMVASQLELAADYLEMAALLTEIKSRMLLPKAHANEEEESDPRAELIRRLQEYERFKTAAQQLDTLPREERDFYQISVAPPAHEYRRALPEVRLQDLLSSYQHILSQGDLQAVHTIQREPLSVRERMSRLLEELTAENFDELSGFFEEDEGRLGVVVTFLAALELAKEALVEIVQTEPFGPIYLRIAA